MKKLLIITILLFVSAQAHPENMLFQDEVKVGDVLVLGKPSTQKYQHVHFPKTNFIIKKGGIANYKKLNGQKVIITNVEKDSSGKTIITIKRKDGKKFFGVVATTKVHFEQGLESKEIIQKTS